ncbi:MAG: cystathionine gamma-synthase [Sulfobacillus benefaciens]|uniref:cysteine-S-conjugate beta-lyase n=1 Tax=Sulfobacillus benefaciens TaxID=453960 RepID=A0A2T2XF09_9FIRM|nr:MAG: cystathionine gamma-synthase [Sulfobacillus benefaciens]
MRFSTQLIHNASTIDSATGAASPPIHHASTFHQSPYSDKPQTFVYSRSKNPTRSILEETIAELEGGIAGFAFGSGMAAIAAVFTLFSSGDHLIVTRDLYGGTQQILKQLGERYGLKVTYVDMTDLQQVTAHIGSRTRAIYVETPSNPTLTITDLRAVSSIAKSHNLLTIADDTFMTPYLQRPLELGFDIVVHSATKFLAGHSDVIAGLAIVKSPDLKTQLEQVQVTWGGILGPDDSWLTLRGIKTLGVRMDRAQQNALQLAAYLDNHPRVSHVYYPGLSHHPGHALQQEQARGPGAVLSFELPPALTVHEFVSRLRYAIFAVSLGGVETIVSHPASMSHAKMTSDARQAIGVTDQLLRVSVGIEAIEDLIEDFEQALNH